MISSVIRLAFYNPSMRKDLVPLIKKALAPPTEGDGEEEEAETKGKKKGPPPHWDEFWTAKYQAGKKKVQNSNPKTKGKFPQVSTNTKFKNDKVFRAKVMKEYGKWIKENPELNKGTSKSKKPEAPSKVKPPKKEEEKKPKKEKQPEKKKPSGKLKMPNGWKFDTASIEKKIVELTEKFNEPLNKFAERVKTVRKDTEKFFDSKMEARKAKIQSMFDSGFYSSEFGASLEERLKDDFEYPRLLQEKTLLQGLSDAEILLHMHGDELGLKFEKHLKETNPNMYNQQRSFAIDWQGSSSSTEANKLHGLLASMGVSGKPKHEGEGKRSRDEGAKDKKFKEWFETQYAFTQAVMQKLGIKEVTVYRGVSSQINGEPPMDGDEVSLHTRESSSWSSNLAKAYGFGRPAEVKIPVERIAYCNIVDLGFGRNGSEYKESEYIVMGSSDLKSKAMSPSIEVALSKQSKSEKSESGKQAASKKKPFEVTLDKKNEDWLPNLRKKEKKDKDKSKKEESKDKKDKGKDKSRGKKATEATSLRSMLTRVAFNNPELRPFILPLLKPELGE